MEVAGGSTGQHLEADPAPVPRDNRDTDPEVEAGATIKEDPKEEFASISLQRSLRKQILNLVHTTKSDPTLD
ncbi:hypothetical protein scyTo_0000103 [Scyliorhinus torazame]|uniref:Uncharacterized protein n=1 Tax=Scyliorhinus torazame TaxID=75743 RepID=A0A401NQ65_SCYTO|nr:hypothetical protein [Scyliorhinus torazame]